MNFKVGDLIIGKKDNGYAVTNSCSLLLVIRVNTYDMEVMVLYHNDQSNQIEETYTVENNESYFDHITINEFVGIYPYCFKMNRTKLYDILSKYSGNHEEKKSNPYVLSDEMRNELLNEMKELLCKYHYHPTDQGLNKIIDEWCLNKADLIRLFEKHPNYNGKFQITFDCDFDRTIDREAVYKFRCWLMSEDVRETLLKEVKKGMFTYEELIDICGRLNNFCRVFDRHGYINEINGKTYEDYHKEYKHFKKYKQDYEMDEDICTYGDKAYTAESYSNYEKLEYLDNILYSTNTLEQFVNDNARDYIERYFANAKIKKGQKLSRAINKILTMMEINKHADYNKEFAKFADAINPLKIKRHTVISIHPIDFFTMSFGNSWSSCHTIDKGNDRGIASDSAWRGCNSSGTMSYMLDETSCMFYTVDANYDGNTIELEDKINRCMFHYNDNQLVQGRIYPQSNDSGSNNLYRDIREIAQKVFSDMLEVPNYWTNKNGTDACYEVVSSIGTHYKDYYNYNNCNVSTLKDGKEMHDVIRIGHNPICPCCGTNHSRTRNIECYDCNDLD